MSFVFREEENIQCEKWCLCFKLNHHFVTNEIPRQPASAATQRDIQPTSANSKHFEHVTLLRAAVPTPTIETAAPSRAAGHTTSARWWVIKAGGALAPCPRKAATAKGKDWTLCCQRATSHPADCQVGWAEDGEQPKGKMGLFKLSSLSSPFKELPQENLFQSYWAWQQDLYQYVNTVLGPCGLPGLGFLLTLFRYTDVLRREKLSFQERARIPTLHATMQGCKHCHIDN